MYSIDVSACSFLQRFDSWSGLACCWRWVSEVPRSAVLDVLQVLWILLGMELCPPVVVCIQPCVN
jgi:hypothetical protein